MIHAYLNEYVNGAKIVFKKEAIAIQDMNYRHVFHTDSYLKLIHHDGSLIGKRYQEIETRGRVREYARKIIEISKHLETHGGKARYIINGFAKDGTQYCYIVEESLIIDPNTNEKVGRLIKIEALDVSFMWQILRTTSNFRNPMLKLDDYPLQIIKSNTNFSFTLTDREKEILFLMIIGEKYKSIASILSHLYSKDVKESSVRNTVHNQLFIKFKVFNNEMLIDKVIQNNFIKQIPEKLIRLLDGLISAQIIQDE